MRPYVHSLHVIFVKTRHPDLGCLNVLCVNPNLVRLSFQTICTLCASMARGALALLPVANSDLLGDPYHRVVHTHIKQSACERIALPTSVM